MNRPQYLTFYLLIIFLSFIILLFDNNVLSQELPEGSYLENVIANIKESKSFSFRGDSISAVNVLTDFYVERGYRQAWNDKEITELLTEIKEIYSDGLNPDDYHYKLLSDLFSESKTDKGLTPSQQAIFDIFLTDSLLRITYHLRYGKVDPLSLDPNWNLPKIINKRKELETIENALESGSITNYISELVPKHYYYTRMKKALAYYREIELNGGWKKVEYGPSLKPGMTDPRVKELRSRLTVTSDMPDEVTEHPEYFDDTVETGVLEFQKRHGLEEDGIAGIRTIRAMNVPVHDRINQIRVNLERARWVLHDLPPKFLIVNIAGFTAFLVENGMPVWTTKVVVGKTYRKTPVFRALMRYIVFNPTWTVPPIILRNDILPAVREDPMYLKEKNIKVLDLKGNEVAQNTINWNNYTWKNFPYILRQDPGPENALGVVKFIFPNNHFVFLHDTPSKSLFDKDVRTFSSGCIRIDKPLELAELLLRNQDEWNSNKIKEVIEQKITRTVTLEQPIPVLILYWTSRVDGNGRVEFLPDVYNRDASVLRDLDARFH